MLRYIIILIVLLVSTIDLFAQPPLSTTSKKAISLFSEADQAFNALEFDKAIELLDEALQKDANFIEAYLLQAEVYHDSKNHEKELDRFAKVIEINPEYNPMIWSRHGAACLNLGRYEEAKKSFKRYLEFPKLSLSKKEQGEYWLELAEFGIYSMENPVAFKPVNMGKNINSTLNERWPSLTADEQTMIITIEIPRPGAEQSSPMSPKTQEDLYVSQWEGDHWAKVYNIGSEINTPSYNEGTQAFSVDGQHLFYTVCNKPGDYGRCDLYYSRKVGPKWTLPENIGPPISTSAWESHPSFSSDGKTLFFISARNGGKGEMDIWTSTLLEDGTWSPPTNLGDSINTPSYEMSPFIHPDNQTLYFASNGHIGMGGFDIFYSRRKQDGTWSKPKNMGYPINTYRDEHGMIVNASGNLAYFSSDRFSENLLDIYQFELYEEARPKLVTYVKGRVYDAETLQGIDARFELTDLDSDELVVESTSDKNTGKYLVCLTSGQSYAFNVFKKGYNFHSETFTLKNFTDTTTSYVLDFALTKIDTGVTVILKNIFFETDSYELKNASYVELKKLTRFMDQNKGIEIEIGGHTDNVGSKQHNQELSSNRAKTVYNYLIENGIQAHRLSYRGYDFTVPIDTNDTPEGRAKNRRTEFKITKKE